MSGKKGRSGRLPKSCNNYKQAVIERSWRLLNEKLRTDDVDRFQYARDIATKDITQRVQAEQRIITQEQRERVDELSRLLTVRTS